MEEGGRIVHKPFCRMMAFVVPSVVVLLLVFPARASAQSQGDTLRTSGTTQAEAGWGRMTAQQRQQAIEYSDTKHILYFISLAYGLVVLLFVLFTGLSARLRDRAKAIGRRRFFTLAIFLLLFLLVTAALSLPLDFYSGYLVEHTYGLSNQSVGAWMWDQVKSFLISWVIMTLVVAILYALIRKFARTWWLWFGVGSLPFVVFFVVIAPVVLMPMFYTIKPMEETALKARLLSLASDSGIENPEVFEMNASKETKKLNAMVTGLGKTKRIIIYDNMLQQMKDDEILFVVGHELGHYVLHHVWIAVFIAALSILVFSVLTSVLIGRIIGRYAPRLGFSRLSDIASFPLILLFITIFEFVFSPVTNGVWRHFEHVSDVYGMDHTGNGDAAARAFEKLAAVNLSNPNPSAFIEFWLYDHPKLSDRVNFVRSYHPPASPSDSLRFPGERHLRNIHQLTFGGENAEAYLSADGRMLIFQSTRDTFLCDQIFTMRTDGGGVRLVSTGKGVTTCSFFAPDGGRIIYSSTHLGGPACPPKPSHERGYVWPLHPAYDVFSADPDGSGLLRLTDTPGYDAEAVYAPDGKSILFTSVRDGDLELYLMDSDGSNVRRLTHQIGYDGGAFFSPDGKRIVYRAHHPQEPADVAEYQALLKDDLVRPAQMEIFVMDADGSNRRQVTRNGAANFCPFFHPNGRQIIFASNLDDPQRRNFELYLINDDGAGLDRVTYNDTFDGFPMFTRDGTKLVFASNRNNQSPSETNIFIADWIE